MTLVLGAGLQLLAFSIEPANDETIAASWIAWVVLRAGESATGGSPAESPIGAAPDAPGV